MFTKTRKTEMEAAKTEMARAGIARAAAWGPIMLSCDPICERRAQNRGQNRDQTEVKTEIKSCAVAQAPTLSPPHLPATLLHRADVALPQWFPVPWLGCCGNSCEPCFATLRVDRPWSARMVRARERMHTGIRACARSRRILRLLRNTEMRK